MILHNIITWKSDLSDKIKRNFFQAGVVSILLCGCTIWSLYREYLDGNCTKLLCPVGWGCRIHRLLLCRGVRTPPHACPGYDTKQFDGEVPALLEL